MSDWPVHAAKSRFSELLETCLREGPQVVTRRGKEEAVLIPAETWRQLKSAARPTLKDLLLSDHTRVELDLPERGKKRRRTPPQLG